MSFQMNPYQQNQSNQAPLLPPDSYTQENYQYSQPVAQDIRQSYNAYQNNGDFVAELNPLLNKDGSKHIRSLIASLILLIGQIVILVLYFLEQIQLEIEALIGICVGIYIFYLMLALCCNPMISYLGNIEHGLNFDDEYNKIRNIQGHFEFHAQCYHYETRYHTRQTTDSNGQSRTQTYTTTEKVITHTATEQLYPGACTDDSGNVQRINALTQVVFVHNKVNYRFFNDQSRWNFDRHWGYFQSRHRRDVHQDYSQKFVMPGLKARMTFYIGESPKNYKCNLILCSLIGMIWPYSMYVEGKVTRYDIEYMKIVTI